MRQKSDGRTALTQSDQIYRRLRRAIMTCELDPGTRLKVLDIAALEKVSPGAVREALSRLTTEHLVTPFHQRGFWVSTLSIVDMQQLFAARADLESALVGESVRFNDSAWRQAVNDTHRALVDSQLAMTEEGTQAHEAFHRALASGCRNLWSLRMFDTLYTASERYRFYAYRHVVGSRNVTGEHDALRDAALSGDVASARDLSWHHTMRTRDLLSAALAARASEDEKGMGTGRG